MIVGVFTELKVIGKQGERQGETDYAKAAVLCGIIRKNVGKLIVLPYFTLICTLLCINAYSSPQPPPPPLSPVSSARLSGVLQLLCTILLLWFACSKGFYPGVQAFACSAGNLHSKPSFLLAQMGKGKTYFCVCFLKTQSFPMSLPSRYEKLVNSMLNIEFSLK